MISFDSGSGGRGRILLMAGAAAAILFAVAVLVMSLFGGAGSPQPRATQYTCGSCGHTWQQSPAEEIRCPKCGGREAVVKTYFRCPQCGGVFHGLDSRKIAVGKYQYRLSGTKDWHDQYPPRLTCPNCGYSDGRMLERGVAGEVIGTPPTGLPACQRPGGALSRTLHRRVAERSIKARGRRGAGLVLTRGPAGRRVQGSAGDTRGARSGIPPGCARSAGAAQVER